MLRIRLRRQGARKQPTYRIVVADQRDARDGRFVEVIGHYNPRTEPAVADVDEARAFHWLGNGARPAEAVDRIFGWTGTRDRFSRLKQGEELSQLLSEAEKAAADRPAPTKTRHLAPTSAVRPKKGTKTDPATQTDVNSVDAEDAVAETGVEADVSGKPEREVVSGAEPDVETEVAAESEDDLPTELEGETKITATAEVEDDPGAVSETDLSNTEKVDAESTGKSEEIVEDEKESV